MDPYVVLRVVRATRSPIPYQDQGTWVLSAGECERLPEAKADGLRFRGSFPFGFRVIP